LSIYKKSVKATFHGDFRACQAVPAGAGEKPACVAGAVAWAERSFFVNGRFNITVGQTAELLGISTMTVNRNRHLIEGMAGAEFHETTENRCWRRNQLMTPEEEEAEFLGKFLDQSLAGELIDAAPIHNQLRELAGHDIPLSTTYRMLERNGWRKTEPDTSHPKSDPAPQEGFKKTPKNAGFHLEEKQRKITCKAGVSRRSQIWSTLLSSILSGSISEPTDGKDLYNPGVSLCVCFYLPLEWKT
jgi:hypothetical protein